MLTASLQLSHLHLSSPEFLMRTVPAFKITALWKMKHYLMKTLISTSENVDFYIYMYIYVSHTELSCKLKSDNFYTSTLKNMILHPQ